MRSLRLGVTSVCVFMDDHMWACNEILWYLFLQVYFGGMYTKWRIVLVNNTHSPLNSVCNWTCVVCIARGIKTVLEGLGAAIVSHWKSVEMYVHACISSCLPVAMVNFDCMEGKTLDV